MSATNGTAKTILGPDGLPVRRHHRTIEERLDRTQKKLRLIEADAKLRAYQFAQKKQKRLIESWDSSSWLNALSDGIDRGRSFSDDFIAPISTANDVRYGDAFPFFRSLMEHARLRAASRLIYTMSPLVRGAISGVGAYVVGEGMRSRAATKHDDCPKPLLEAVQTWLDEWEKDNRWLSRQRECFTRRERDGEFFVRLFPQDDGWTLVRIVEPMFVVEPPGMPMEIGKYGIITDPEDIIDVRGYWVSHTGLASDGEQVSSSLMRMVKSGILDEQVKRGMPVISYDMLDYYRVVGRLLENMGTGAAIQAAIAFVRQHEIAPGSAVADFVGGLATYDQTQPVGGRNEHVQRFEAGTVIDMDAGQKFVETGFASNVQNYSACVQAILRAVAVHYSAPEWIVSADASNNSYSSSLTAESPFVKRCKQTQTDFQAVFHWAVESALKHYCRVKRGIRAAGRLWLWEEVRHYIDIQVTPPTVETRDRQAEAQVNQTYISLGVKSRQTVAQELSLDFEREELNNKQYEEAHGEQGVPQKMRAGEGGGGPDDPNGPQVAGIGGEGEDDNAAFSGDGPAANAGAAVEDTDDAGAPNTAGDSSADDLLASAGLDDLFSDLGLPDTAPAAPDDQQGTQNDAGGDDAAGGTNDLRATVGGFNALRDMQTAVYGGELPREAAIASAKLMLGFTDEEADGLFPEIVPVNTQDGGEGGGDGETPGQPTSPVEGVMESVRRLLTTGRTVRRKRIPRRQPVAVASDGSSILTESELRDILTNDNDAVD